VVDEVMPLAQAARAQRRLEAAEQFGKIVLVAA
jgi:NADPH:quinone reductase-like Zn-dependent oxidoreductase